MNSSTTSSDNLLAANDGAELLGMLPPDIAILAAAIRRHGVERLDSMDYPSDAEKEAAQLCARKIAGTFAHFASVNKDVFMLACGLAPRANNEQADLLAGAVDHQVTSAADR